MNDPTELILLPSLKAHKGKNGGLVMTQKYMNGAAAFAKRWPGKVTSLVEVTTIPSSDMDHIEVMPGMFETELEVRPVDANDLEPRIQDAGLVLGFLSRFEAPTAQMCQRLGVPIVFTSEYTPQTERQIVDANTNNPLLRLRRKFWIMRSELIRQRILKIANGLQCNGTPTYDIYKDKNANTLLFFDNRVPEAALVSDTQVAAKARTIASDDPIRLIFGGRLISMKGAQELPKVADALQKLGVPFTMDIYGKGPLEGELSQQIRRLGLTSHVTLHGALDFETGWIPTLKESADLFVCCHVQGDPSGTYPEVLSCGVPIVGYDNEALLGAVVKSQGGWATPMQKPELLAQKIKELNDDRSEIVRAADAGRRFGGAQTFEPTMDRRSAHLIRASRLPEKTKEAALAAISSD